MIRGKVIFLFLLRVSGINGLLLQCYLQEFTAIAIDKI